MDSIEIFHYLNPCDLYFHLSSLHVGNFYYFQTLIHKTYLLPMLTGEYDELLKESDFALAEKDTVHILFKDIKRLTDYLLSF